MVHIGDNVAIFAPSAAAEQSVARAMLCDAAWPGVPKRTALGISLLAHESLQPRKSRATVTLHAEKFNYYL